MNLQAAPLNCKDSAHRFKGLIDNTMYVVIGVIVVVLSVVYWLFFRGEDDTKTSFAGSSGSNAFKSVAVVPKASSKSAPKSKLSKKQQAKAEVSGTSILVEFSSRRFCLLLNDIELVIWSNMSQ